MLTRVDRLRATACLLLLLSVPITSGCGQKDRQAAQNLAKTGSKTAGTLADYYDSLADNLDRRPELEIFYGDIQAAQLPSPTAQDLDTWEKLALELRHRAQTARDLASVYDALQNLASKDTSSDVNKSVDRLAGSLKQVSVDPKIGKAEPSDMLKPAIGAVVDWQRSRSLRKAVETVRPTLMGIKNLFDDETQQYLDITDRQYTMLIGDKTTNPASPTTGIAEHLMQTESMSMQFLLQQIPELQGLPWNPGAVQDAATKKAMQQALTQDLTTLESKSKQTPKALSDSLASLAAEHDKFLQRQSLTLATVLQNQEHAQTYLDLLRKLRGK